MSTRTVRVLTMPLTAALVALPALLPAAAHASSGTAGDHSCRRGCSFTMSKGGALDIDPRLGLRKLTVIAVGDGWVDFRVRGTQEPLDIEGTNVSASSSCTASRCVNTGVVGVDVGYPGRVNRLAIRLDDTYRGEAYVTVRALD